MILNENKKRMISGIKPSCYSPTLGNYLGVIKPFVSYQDDYDLFVFIADLHALTIRTHPDELRKNIKNLISTYLAAGLDPKKVTIFKQSDIPAHNQLEWVLTCSTNLSELTKMPQYKNYIVTHKNDPVPSGMLLYPSLMNADILLYDAKYVPVGEDQKPHVDLTRDVAIKFNKIYGNTFEVPEAILAKQGTKIMSLSDPTRKMSKSESDKGTIYLLDDLDTIRQKIKKATTDSEYKIYYDPVNKPGVSNLMMIMSCLTGISISEIQNQFQFESNYGIFKEAVADVVCDEIARLQTKIAEFKNSDILDTVLAAGAKYAKSIAEDKIANVYKKIGLS